MRVVVLGFICLDIPRCLSSRAEEWKGLKISASLSMRCTSGGGSNRELPTAIWIGLYHQKLVRRELW